MFLVTVSNMIAICVGVAIVWGWVAFISEATARRTGRTPAVPYPDEVLWALLGGLLLGLGLFGGVFALPRLLQRSRLLRRLRGRSPRFRDAGLRSRTAR